MVAGPDYTIDALGGGKTLELLKRAPCRLHLKGMEGDRSLGILDADD